MLMNKVHFTTFEIRQLLVRLFKCLLFKVPMLVCVVAALFWSMINFENAAALDIYLEWPIKVTTEKDQLKIMSNVTLRSLYHFYLGHAFLAMHCKMKLIK